MGVSKGQAKRKKRGKSSSERAKKRAPDPVKHNSKGSRPKRAKNTKRARAYASKKDAKKDAKKDVKKDAKEAVSEADGLLANKFEQWRRKKKGDVSGESSEESKQDEGNEKKPEEKVEPENKGLKGLFSRFRKKRELESSSDVPSEKDERKDGQPSEKKSSGYGSTDGAEDISEVAKGSKGSKQAKDDGEASSKTESPAKVSSKTSEKQKKAKGFGKKIKRKFLSRKKGSPDVTDASAEHAAEKAEGLPAAEDSSGEGTDAVPGTADPEAKNPEAGAGSTDEIKAALKAKLEKKLEAKKAKKIITEIDLDDPTVKLLKTYEFDSKNIPITINIVKKKGEFVPLYDMKIARVSRHTEIFLEKIRKELIKEVNLGIVDITDLKKSGIVEQRFSETIVDLLNKYFPDIDDETMNFLTTYLIQKSLGLGKLELLRDDPNLEEIAINSADEPIWVYHREFAWVKTTVMLEGEDQTRHFASIIGRRVGRQLTVLEPLLDANLSTGDRINATLMPISNRGNTITLRRFASKPWTITDLVRSKTMSAETASLIWLGIQYELSLLIAGGTASGKTSTLNSLCNFFPPNHRIISIEDTREVKLPSFLHWIPMVTRLPNAEGKGEVGMLHLLVNALRQRPDRILVGEVRRKKEAEVLFEAIHTGHSVYATFHANNAHEAITRLTSPPIEVPKAMLPAISMILVQYRNRRSGLRRTFQVAEITEEGDQNVILQYDAKKDIQVRANPSKTLMSTLELYTGMTRKEIDKSIAVKSRILKWMVKHNINTVDTVGRVMAEYYTDYDNLMKFVNRNRPFGLD